MPHRTILIEPGAPSKPAYGAPCNGCGICCLVEPCPLGIVFSGRRTGACARLRWDAGQQVYRCGALPHPSTASWWGRAHRWCVRRWIGAGAGCDCVWEGGRGIIQTLPIEPEDPRDGSP